MLKELKDLNKSSWFILPLFNLDKSYDNFLYNTYITHTDPAFDGLVGSLYVVFKFNGRISNLFGDVDPYLELEQKLIQKEEYLCHYDINKGEYVVFCLSVSDLYEKDYEYFIDGKYSKIRREIKDYKTPCTPAYNLINTRWKDQGVTGVNIKCIMDKSSLLKKQFETLKGIEIPEGAEIFTSYQDKHFKEKEHFDESKLTLKTFLR